MNYKDPTKELPTRLKELTTVYNKFGNALTESSKVFSEFSLTVNEMERIQQQRSNFKYHK